MTFVRYVIIQLLAYAIDMGGFLALLHLGLLGAIYANAVSKIAAGCFAFVAHQSFTFRLEKGRHDFKQVIRYAALLTINVPLSSTVLAAVLLVVEQAVVAKFISDVACVALTFFTSKMWVFRTHDSRSPT